MRIVLALAVLFGMTAPAMAETVYQFPDDEDESVFIVNEMIVTLYHEMGHALIDVLQLPVLGKEEDAADQLSVVLMNDLSDEESVAAALSSAAIGYALQDEQRAAGAKEPAYAREHSLDMQRYFNVVCLFYGANPEKRQQLADKLRLPAERAEHCPTEWAAATGPWDALLQNVTLGDGKFGLETAEGQVGLPLANVLAEEVNSINERIGLPQKITVIVADCGEAKAFYTPENHSITMCNEYAQYLQDMWDSSQQ